MRAYLADRFPIVLSAVLPAVGLVLAIQQLIEGKRTMAAQIAAATVLGAVVWVLILV